MTDSRTSRRWRLLLVPPRSGAVNMARDSALMARARVTGETVFSVYGWSRPTLSLGRNQIARGRYDLDAIAEHGIDVVRRPTGGRALLHDREVTYSVTAPVESAVPLRKSYERLNRILLDGLSRLGVAAEQAGPQGRLASPTDLPCFADPAVGELVTGGQKLVGSAQFRENGALLQHGSILIEDDQSFIRELMLTAPPIAPPPATLTAALRRRPTVDEVAAALFAAVAGLDDQHASPLAESETDDGTREHLERYRSQRWTWRR